ncbi:MAG: ABC transporter ATP-binding protein [Bauldia sp.]|uniref:ABC transporter ATP-binding protein n=1 Tax=Bauldia sp. TaxID=2575872 RepID=UPI001D58C9D7|nr:ABC transporter ATP-binding protein [Bauldia sp.]MCB1494733.1 ABC transporter ATP-binding protein [Bauldia sp.]
MPEPILAVTELDAFYGDFQALFAVSVAVEPGEVLAMIGANGAGKSTFLKAVAGVIPAKREAIRFRGESIGGLSADRILKRGIALVPEGRRLFPSLSVEENLMIGGQLGRKGRWSLETVYALFPVLGERRNQASTSLSGGQQQMCAIGRALMANPDFILFDEISLGLAPVIIKDIYAALPGIVAGGAGAVIVEQDITRALSVATRVVCLQEGRVSLQGRPADLDRAAISAAYFGT